MKQTHSQKRKNPLRHRYLREIRSDFWKYLVIFFLMTFSIAEVSGFLVADGSMIRAYEESFEKYHIENGHFETGDTLTPGQIRKIEALGVTLHQNFYTEVNADNESTIRIFPKRTEVNLEALMKGAFPEKDGEIALDRMYAENNDIRIGDTLTAGKRSWVVTGYVALSDYSALFEDNSDSMFDAMRFGVATVTETEFEKLAGSAIRYCYAWTYAVSPADETEEKDTAETLMKEINAIVPLESYVPRYANQAIRFTGNDMGSDEAMMTVLLYMIIAILGFVFAVTISSTISKEAGVIGTLRASGYTRGELTRHYMFLPVLVTLVSAAVGNVLGYTLIKNVIANLYYGSYSLPTYHTVWNMEAFWKTTLVPILLMVVITWLILHEKLKLSPLRFLRRDLRRRRQKKAVFLPHTLPIFSRFRLRVLFQNLPNYLVMFIGVLFADVLLMFGLVLPLMLTHYQETISDNLLAKYQYFLTVPASMSREEDASPLGSLLDSFIFYANSMTGNPDAEKFSAATLKTTGEDGRLIEDITIYGIERHSDYVHLTLAPGDVCVSKSLAQKYHLSEGSELTLREAYGDKRYSFTVTGVYDYEGTLCLFLPMDDVNSLFSYENGFFSGYFSDSEITDIDHDYIGTVIDADSLTKVSRQLMLSMGGVMKLTALFSVIMFLILIYLLSKTIIERNETSISMAKILGCTDREIGRLYIRPTTIAVLVMLIAAIPIVQSLLATVIDMYLVTAMPGYFAFYINAKLYAEIFFSGLIAYLVVLVLEMRRIRRIPMDTVLKNVE